MIRREQMVARRLRFSCLEPTRQSASAGVPFYSKRGGVHMRYCKLCAYAFLVLLILLAGCQSPDDSPRTTTPQEQASAQNTQVHPTVSAVASEGQDGQWNVVHQMQVEHRPKFAAFMDQEFGITGCSDNPATVHYTSDGGQSWTRAENIEG